MTRKARRNFTFDDEITLVEHIYTDNEKGEQLPELDKNIVLASVQNVYGADYYAAANAGLKPSVKFVIKYLEYKNQEEIIYNNQTYRVIRVFRIDNEDIELECEKNVIN